MEAVAYQALVEGTCKPICREGTPEPCSYGEHMLLSPSPLCCKEVIYCYPNIAQLALCFRGW